MFFEKAAGVTFQYKLCGRENFLKGCVNVFKINKSLSGQDYIYLKMGVKNYFEEGQTLKLTE